MKSVGPSKQTSNKSKFVSSFIIACNTEVLSSIGEDAGDERLALNSGFSSLADGIGEF